MRINLDQVGRDRTIIKE